MIVYSLFLRHLDELSAYNSDSNGYNVDLDSDINSDKEFVDSHSSNNNDISHLNVENDNLEENFDLKEFLSHWAVTFQIRQTALTNLLHGLKKSGHRNLPNDARTLLNTPKKNCR